MFLFGTLSTCIYFVRSFVDFGQTGTFFSSIDEEGGKHLLGELL